MNYPKRLIEVDLPIRRISEHARREKSIRHGHISTLHIWWARRPLAACRAVICSSLWPDPVDPLCPLSFIDTCKREMIRWSANDMLSLLSRESYDHFIKLNNDASLIENKEFLRVLLFDFIADFSNWDNSCNSNYINTSRTLTEQAHISLGGIEGTSPILYDPFAGGGAIPLEAARVGCESFATDINEVPIFINKVMLEGLTKSSVQTLHQFNEFAEKLNKNVGEKLQHFYTDSNEEIFAFFWCRSVVCEGPNCGKTVPMMGNPLLSNKPDENNAILAEYVNGSKTPTISLVKSNHKNIRPYSKGGAALCECDFVTPVASVRKQLIIQKGGTDSCILLAIGFLDENGKKKYRSPNVNDYSRLSMIDAEYEKIADKNIEGTNISVVPKEHLWGKAKMNVGLYGIYTWDKVFLKRQLICLTTYQDELKRLYLLNKESVPKIIFELLAITIDKIVDYCTSLCRWVNGGEFVAATIGGEKKLPLMWDFPEIVPFKAGPGTWGNMTEWVSRVIEHFINSKIKPGHATYNDARDQFLPDDSVQAIISDPPYYDAIWYSDLSDLFTVWIKRSMLMLGNDFFKDERTVKNAEIIKSTFSEKDGLDSKNDEFYEAGMFNAFCAMRKSLEPSGIATIVFAHKSTSGWETVLSALINSGFIVTSSWPIDTERAARMTSINQAALASSIHLVCRPRENADGSLNTHDIGYWNDVLRELPNRIHDWMPRLSEEGVVGADAIFACIGPALEIFSRYSKVIMPGSEREVSLREYLEKVWEAVSKEALAMIFDGVDTTGFEEDSRITAMWLWTISTKNKKSYNTINPDLEIDGSTDENPAIGNDVKIKSGVGFELEYDTARRIAQGLGAELSEMNTLIDIQKDKARLLPVSERAKYLFGSDGIKQQAIKKKTKTQISLFENMVEESELGYEMPELKIEQIGTTILDRLHQAMLLFATSRTDALKRFLLEDGTGKDERFWKLAQALTALYPNDTDERRWVEAVQTYKKGLGF